MLEIHQTRNLVKQFEAMRKGGKKERDILLRAETIMVRLQDNSLDEKAECRRTYNGEVRLKDCRKYSLSCGFRLIGLKRENRLIFTYIGSHDDCQRWIENNRSCLDEIESVPLSSDFVERSTDLESDNEAVHHCPEDEYEVQLMEQLDEHLLREVFPAFARESV
ncbi:Type II toxin-antitoxin system RelE/ParE family toxin [Candidatus Electrothrix aarhusensis]